MTTEMQKLRQRVADLARARAAKPATGMGMKTGMQRLRQKIADALEGARAAKPAMGMGLEGRLTMQGIQVGSISMLEVVLDWIDEITEGDNEDHQPLD